MLSHLASKLGDKRVGDKLQVTDAAQYRSVYELADQQESVYSCVIDEGYKGRLENLDDFFSQKCGGSIRTADTSEIATN